MCGIAGYVGKRNAIDVVIEQLQRLEYRGYDSAGVAFHGPEGLQLVKRSGKLKALRDLVAEQKPDSHSAIAHSRWATHGPPSDLNAHPHYDQSGNLALIHNGIIENYLELKEELTREGHAFHSETDTEVAAHLIGRIHEQGVPLAEAVRDACRRLRGAYAFVAVSAHEPGVLVCARHTSPLVLGLGEGEQFLASDIPAILPFTRKVLVLENEQIGVLKAESLEVFDFHGTPVKVDPFTVDWDLEAAEKGGYEHFMLKEIHEQPDVVQACLTGRINEAELKVELDQAFSEHVWQEIDRVNIIACGTAYHAGLMGKVMFEHMLQLPTDVFYSSEFRYGDPLLSPKSLAIFISQSGETADTLAALRLCKERRIRTLGIVNVVGSSIARECDRTLLTQAGPEISVASTKAYTAQVLVLKLLALYIAQVKEMPGVRVDHAVQDLLHFGAVLRECLALEPDVKAFAERYPDPRLVFFLGRGTDAYTALEAALKLKEIAYVPTQEAPAGEMKHGPLALIDPDVVSIFGATESATREKLASNLNEVKARKGVTAVVTTRDDHSFDEIAQAVWKVPSARDRHLTALASIVPLQLYAYHLAKLRGCEIDQPRNLAKSVTVE